MGVLRPYTYICVCVWVCAYENFHYTKPPYTQRINVVRCIGALHEEFLIRPVHKLLFIDPKNMASMLIVDQMILLFWILTLYIELMVEKECPIALN